MNQSWVRTPNIVSTRDGVCEWEVYQCREIEKSEKEGRARERERERKRDRHGNRATDRDICSRKETGIRGTSTSLRINAWVQESERRWTDGLG